MTVGSIGAMCHLRNDINVTDGGRLLGGPIHRACHIVAMPGHAIGLRSSAEPPRIPVRGGSLLWQDGRQSTGAMGRPLLLTIRRATTGVAKPLGDLGDLFRPPPEDVFVALGDEPPACRARDGVAVSLEPRLVSVEFVTAHPRFDAVDHSVAWE